MFGKPIKTSYESKDVAIPGDFLRKTPYDARPIVLEQIDFAKTVLPEYAGAYAVVLDNVLSKSECDQLIALAESSVPEAKYTPASSSSAASPWQPALVNVGAGYEVHVPDYRNSDRIIWDNQEIVDRMWARLEPVPGIRERLASFTADQLLRPGAPKKNGKPAAAWDFHCVNKRLRFLRYGPGQFFRPHCDGPYGEEGPNGEVLRTHFTVHLYLNDSKQALGEGDERDGVGLKGGATSFLSSDEKRKMDVDPKAGRVLIFQHSRLYHSGDDVKTGLKYTVRSDIMYKMRTDK